MNSLVLSLVMAILGGFFAHALWRAGGMNAIRAGVAEAARGRTARRDQERADRRLLGHKVEPVILQGWCGLFGAAGGIILAIAAFGACLAAGPLGWLAAFFVVPAAFGLGMLAGMVIGYVALFAMAGGLLWLAWLAIQNGLH
jgi:hypothetical protein